MHWIIISLLLLTKLSLAFYSRHFGNHMHISLFILPNTPTACVIQLIPSNQVFLIPRIFKLLRRPKILPKIDIHFNINVKNYMNLAPNILSSI